MFKSLREMRHHLSEIEASVAKQSQTVSNMYWDLHVARRENADNKLWNSKLRAKNSALRKERRHLRALLETHGIAHKPLTFHETHLRENQEGV